MRKLLALVGVYILIILFIPYILVTALKGAPQSGQQQSAPETEQAAAAEPIETISVYIADTGEVRDMPFGEYIKGVVAAEMPASFHDEALKAQAVAARSYTLTRMQGYKRDGTTPEHNGAMTCTDPAHCKAWLSEDALRAQWGADYDTYWKKISDCVDATTGVVMTYEGNLVNAVFHSTSSGATESAVDVWGGNVPYLVSVQSEGEELSPKYEDSVTMTIEEFKNKVLAAYPEAVWDDGELVRDIARSDAGGITTLVTGGVTMKGTEFRTMFGLRSTNVDFSYEGDTVTMHTKGNGHGVGMSQYGANYLAGTGMGYADILKKYYTGVEVGAFTGTI